MSVDYVTSFLDPFDRAISQPKLLDGSVDRSSGLRFRNTGQFALDKTGNPNYLFLIPGFSNCFAYSTAANQMAVPFSHASHVATQADRANIKRIRNVSTGLRLTLLNSADQNEGYWEAVRVPISNELIVALAGEYRVSPPLNFAIPNMANYHSYQRGMLKDIHRFQFKLNSINPDHEWMSPRPLDANVTVGDTYDPTFDMIVIKIVGRIDATIPSTLMYETASNQEVVYTENTALSRLATLSPMVPDMDQLLDRTRYLLPAVQIA